MNTVIDLQGIAIAGASDTVNPEDREIMAREVNELLELAVSVGQTKFRGRFVFAGTETLEKPYEDIRDSAGQITDVGNALRASVTLSDRATAVGTLLGLATPPAGTVTVGDQTVAIDLATDSLDDIKASIDAAAPTGVTVTIEESVRNGQPSFKLRISGTATVADSNNVLGTLNIGNVDTTKAMLREVGAGSTYR